MLAQRFFLQFENFDIFIILLGQMLDGFFFCKKTFHTHILLICKDPIKRLSKECVSFKSIVQVLTYKWHSNVKCHVKFHTFQPDRSDGIKKFALVQDEFITQ